MASSSDYEEGLHKFEADYWVELDKNYVRNIRNRQALYEKYGKAVLDAMPGSEIACKELMEMVFINRILETTTDLLCTPPLVVLLNNVPEDYTIMIRNDDNGQYYLRAAVVMTSIGWSVATKIGRPLDEIHDHVPLYKEKMRLSMNRYFAKLPTDRAMQRGSWTLTPGQLLFIPPGDPILQREPSQDPDLAIEDIYYRLDWQVVRRLPVSGAIVFSFRVLFTPLETFREEPYIPKLCLKFLEDHIPELQKATYPVEHKAVPLLKQWHQEQVERGLVAANWEAGTLPEAPFFPGWKEMYLKERQ